MATFEHGVHYRSQSETDYSITYKGSSPAIKTVQKFYRETMGKTLPAADIRRSEKSLTITSILNYTNKPVHRWQKFLGKLERFED